MGGFLLFMLLAIAGLMAWKMARSLRARTSERHWLPKELQHAQLAFAEKTFRTWQPIGLIARADRGYWLKGELHLVEFKTRTHAVAYSRSEEHTSELQSPDHLVCRLLLEKKKKT